MGRFILVLMISLAAPALASDSNSATWLGKDGTRTYPMGPYRITVAAGKSADEAQLTIAMAGRPPFHVVADLEWFHQLTVSELPIDLKAVAPVVVVETYSGGAHCCAERDFYIPLARGWRHQNVGQEGGVDNLAPIRDIDGDGVLDIISYDRDFDGSFGPNSQSAAPLRIFHLSAGALVDVTHQPGFAPYIKSDMAKLAPWCAKGQNGMCAAYVADATLVGNGARAWAFMMAHYAKDPADDVPFPTQLRQFLTDHHYGPLPKTP